MWLLQTPALKCGGSPKASHALCPSEPVKVFKASAIILDCGDDGDDPNLDGVVDRAAGTLPELDPGPQHGQRLLNQIVRPRVSHSVQGRAKVEANIW